MKGEENLVFMDYINDVKQLKASSSNNAPVAVVESVEEGESDNRLESFWMILGSSVGSMILYNPFRVALVLLSVNYNPRNGKIKNKNKMKHADHDYDDDDYGVHYGEDDVDDVEGEEENLFFDEDDFGFDQSSLNRELARSVGRKYRDKAKSFTRDKTDHQGYLVQEVMDDDDGDGAGVERDIYSDHRQVSSVLKSNPLSSTKSYRHPSNRLVINLFPSSSSSSSSSSSASSDNTKRSAHQSVASLSLLGSLKTISHYIGIAGLYRGLFTGLIDTMGSYYAEMWLRDLLSRQNLLIGVAGSSEVLLPISTAFIAEWASSLLFHPLSLLSTRLICQNVIRKERIYHGFRHGLRMIWREKNGPGGFYRHFGFMSFYYGVRALAAIIPSIVIYAYPTVSMLSRISVIAASSLACSLITIPLETIYYRLLISSSKESVRATLKASSSNPSSSVKKGEFSPCFGLATCVPVKPVYKNGLDVFRKMWREEGFSSFYPLWSYRMASGLFLQIISNQQ